MSTSPGRGDNPVGPNVYVPVYAARRVLVIQAVKTLVTVLVTQSIVRVHLEVVVGHPYVHIADRRTEVMWVAKHRKHHSSSSTIIILLFCIGTPHCFAVN